MLKVVMLSKSTQLPKCYNHSVEDKDAFKMKKYLLIIKGNAVEKEKEAFPQILFCVFCV
jgi:hypothetical protein